MSIDGIRRALGLEGTPQLITKPESNKAEGKGFGEHLERAIGEVASLDNTAQSMVADTMSGKATHAPHELIVALEKADIAFELMSKVRSQIVRAYEEIMRVQV
jgi:flagellar hook-basal body complex protein FliE